MNEVSEYKHAPCWSALVTQGHVWHSRLETLFQHAVATVMDMVEPK